MKKLLTIILCITIIFTFTTGCGQDPAPEDVPEDTQTEVAEDDTQEAVEPETPEEPLEPEVKEYKHTFDPKALSDYWKEIFGKKKVKAWYNLVDAVMAGKDTFKCPDQETLDWIVGQFPEKCFPVLVDLIEGVGECENGVAHIYFKTSRKQFKKKMKKFINQVEGILNETMREDYTDLEKALSLYRYFCANYEYDYETYYNMYDEYQAQVRCYRLFEEGIGICQELATAYSFLLTQVGVDATIMMGGEHTWSYVRINGKNYHIDPTFALGYGGNVFLDYFMMNDEQRFTTYPECEGVELTFASVYTKEHDCPEYPADDDTFKDLWGCLLEDFDHEKHVIRCFVSGEDGELEPKEFNYEGF